MSTIAAPARETVTPRAAWRAGLARLSALMPSSGATREIAAVDGLRALAILLVVWCHLYTQALAHGWPLGPVPLQRIAQLGTSGVDLFFVLSGFLLFLPYARAILAGAPLPSTTKFYYRRILRIVPVYLFALTTLLLFQRPDLLQKGYTASLVLTALLLQDMTQRSIFYVQLLNVVLWTLAVEWQFYLVLPWVARLIRAVAGPHDRRGFGLRLVTAIGMLIVWGLSVRLVASLFYMHTGMLPVDAPHGLGILFALIYGTNGKFLETFALGMALSLLYVAMSEHRQLRRVWSAIFGISAALAAVCGWVGTVLWSTQSAGAARVNPDTALFAPSGTLWGVFGQWVLGACYALLVFAVLLGPPVFSWLFSLAPLRYIGIISYSIYIWHDVIIKNVATIMPAVSRLGYLSLTLKAGIVILLYCSASYYLIERPFLSLRRRAHSASELQLALQATQVAEPVS